MIWHLVFVLIFLNFGGTNSASVNVNVDTNNPLFTVSENYLGVTLDAAERYFSADWFNLNFTAMLPLSAGLGPGILRFGGNRADLSVFVNGGPEVLYTFTSYDLDLLYNYTKNSNWRLIFDLNLQLRVSADKWNSTNAKQFLDYASSKNYTLDFELGNETDQKKDFFKYQLTGTQTGESYNDLRSLLNTYDLYKNSILIGPSVGSTGSPNTTQFLKDFVNVASGAINVLSYHQYNFEGNNATIEQYLDVNSMNRLKHTYDTVKDLPFRPQWLSETGTDWCSCAKNFTDTFLDGFLWLDKIGVSASYGVDRILRQDIIGAPFGLLNGENVSYHTTPDYWLTFLYKKLIGTKVFNVSVDNPDEKLRLYAGSSKNTDGFFVYGINVANYSFTLDIPQLTNHQITAYIIKESQPGNLQSPTSNLNGQEMNWTPHEPIANLKGTHTTLPIEIPEYSQFFIQGGYTNAQSCPQGWYGEKTVPNKCLKLIEAASLPMFSGNFDCLTYASNASLLSVENAFENTEIVGLTSKGNCNNYFVGLYQNMNSWQWANGDQGTYRNWKSGYPTNDNTQKCVIFDGQSGFWTNEDCDNSHCYVCQIYV